MDAQIQSFKTATRTGPHCASDPSSASVKYVYFKTLQGSTASKYEPVMANLDCSPTGFCDVHFSGWSVKSPSGTAQYMCASGDSQPGITCQSGDSG